MNLIKQVPLYLLFLYIPIAHPNNQLPPFMLNNISLSDIIELITLYNEKHLSHSKEIILTANMMTNKTSGMPNTTFANVYGTNFSLSAWKLYPSLVPQDPIHASFTIPKNFNPSGSLVVELQLLTNKQFGAGNMGNIKVNVNYKNSNTEIGETAPASGLSQTVDSGNFTIVEPSQNTNLYQMKISIKLDATLAAKNDFAYLAITRTTPSGIEYNKDIYLASVTFRYE